MCASVSVCKCEGVRVRWCEGVMVCEGVIRFVGGRRCLRVCTIVMPISAHNRVKNAGPFLVEHPIA